jgi:hypothetical protein
MIPQEKSAAVTRGLHEAFRVAEFEDVRMIKNLASSMVFRIIVRGSPYLLKISLRTNDPARHYSCMKTAAQAGLAPRVWYAGEEDRVSIEDFVETAPLAVADALVRVPAALRRLHALPPFPGVPPHINTTCTYLMHNGPAVDKFFQAFQAANIVGKSECDELLARYAELAAVYPHHDPDLVSSHNDLFKPDNILFDGNRLWLVDWEAAFRNDRYVDLAVVANMLVTNEEAERLYLQEYFGAPPNAYQLARFFLMQQVAHIFYATAFLLMGSAGEPIDWSEPVPEYEDFQRRFWAGEVNLEGRRAKTVFGRVHWERLWANVRQERYHEALKLVAGQSATA